MNDIKIIKNAAQCKLCFAVIESKHTHDFQGCDCFNESGGTMGIFVDGWLSYLRRGGDPDHIRDMSQWQDIIEDV